MTYRQIALALWLASCNLAPVRVHAQAFYPWTCDGVPRNPSAVLPQAQAGDPAAMALLSQLYFCDDRLPQSQRLSNSLHWALQAANNGNSSGMMVVGHFYNAGVAVPKKDPQTAGEWYFRAGNTGAGKRAIDALFPLYHNGLYVPQSKNVKDCLDAYDRGSIAFSNRNYAVSLQQMKLSYELGCKWAANAIGVHYEFGDGLPQANVQMALQWYATCAQMGEQDCSQRYNNLYAKQNPRRVTCPSGPPVVSAPGPFNYASNGAALIKFCRANPGCPYRSPNVLSDVRYCTPQGTP